jgi:sorbitol-specific phosphotransferase system component IIBC
MTNQETDTALILENELKRRVTEVLSNVVHHVVQEQIEKRFAQQKENMLMEVSIAVGKMLRVVEEEGRNPLWEATPEEFGLTKEDLNKHHLEKVR